MSELAEKIRARLRVYNLSPWREDLEALCDALEASERRIEALEGALGYLLGSFGSRHLHKGFTAERRADVRVDKLAEIQGLLDAARREGRES